MKKVRQYRQRAKECRHLSSVASASDLRMHFQEMANIWDKLAQERLDFFVEHPESDVHGEVESTANGSGRPSIN